MISLAPAPSSATPPVVTCSRLPTLKAVLSANNGPPLLLSLRGGSEKSTVVEGGEVRFNGKGKRFANQDGYSSLQLRDFEPGFQQTQYLALPERAELAASSWDSRRRRYLAAAPPWCRAGFRGPVAPRSFISCSLGLGGRQLRVCLCVLSLALHNISPSAVVSSALALSAALCTPGCQPRDPPSLRQYD